MPILGEEQLKLLDEPISASLTLSVRTLNALDDREVYSVRDLLACCGKRESCFDCSRAAEPPGCSRIKLLAIANFGKKTLEEIYKALEDAGFYRPEREAEVMAEAREKARIKEKPRRGLRW